ncbi:MAG: acyl carrier protein [Spirochaetales bacterium]|nr:acyl carrier protein [Spirochaetales bacterium]
MKKEPSFKEFKKEVADFLGVEENMLESHTSFILDLGIDSLSLINFVVALEKKYGVRADNESIFNLRTVGEAYELFINKLSGPNTDSREEKSA